MTQTDVDVFVNGIKAIYKNIIKTFNVEYCTDDNNNNYIYLYCIWIKKSQHKKGYGSTIMGELVKFADLHNVQIKLYVTDVFGVDTKVLYAFYHRLGFIVVSYRDGEMIYYPNHCPLKVLI
jgi:ribosomal protein S18 acetylase RimI-like enzyme